MFNYYDDKLSAGLLKRCYELATPRVRRYLQAEIEHVMKSIQPGDKVLELGCGYGRVLSVITRKAGLVVGIDTSFFSLVMGKESLSAVSNCYLVNMDAARLAFRDLSFDVVVCIQNGISAFHVDRRELVRESIRVTRRGGTILFSSYSDNFWGERLEWFQLQARAGLIGEIDHDKTRDGEIVCKDGFTATTIGPGQFRTLATGFDVDVLIEEVDESSLFCEIVKR